MNISGTSLEGYEPDTYWANTQASYPHYPTVRHRARFILAVLRKVLRGGETTVFDYGCGEGTLLRRIHDELHVPADRLAGCDISPRAVEIARRQIGSPALYDQVYPEIERTFDVVICTEVIEHTTEYRKILAWVADHLAPGGTFIVTTQSGKIHQSDLYTGHTQHFRLGALKEELKSAGMTIASARLWGWPLFTLQKYLTDFRFQKIRENYLDGELSFRKRLVFQLAYLAYFAHDLIPYGPQIYVVAKKPPR